MLTTKSDNGLQKTCKTPYLALYTIIYFFLIFSVAFVVREKKDKSRKITMDIYAKVKYNKPNELLGIVNQAFA